MTTPTEPKIADLFRDPTTRDAIRKAFASKTGVTLELDSEFPVGAYKENDNVYIGGVLRTIVFIDKLRGIWGHRLVSHLK